jgi:hypothetical protein
MNRRLGGIYHIQILPSHLLHAGFKQAWFMIMKIWMICSSEMSNHIRTSWSYIPEYGNIPKYLSLSWHNVIITFVSVIMFPVYEASISAWNASAMNVFWHNVNLRREIWSASLRNKYFYIFYLTFILYLFFSYLNLLYFECNNFYFVLFINTWENKFHILSGRSHSRRGKRLLPAVAR